MKYQCTVCGQFSNQKDVCTCCGVGGDKIITVSDSGEDSITYRCLSCGRLFEDKDVCPFCGGEQLYDLTNGNPYDRRKDSKKKNDDNIEMNDDFDLFGSFEDSIKKEDKDDEIFDDKVIILEQKEESKEDKESLIDIDPNENIRINIDEEKLNEEELKNESLEEDQEVESKDEDNLSSKEDDIEFEDSVDLKDEIKKEVEEDSLLDLKIKRIDLTKDLIIKLFMKKESSNDPKYQDLLDNEISILNKLSSSFEKETISSILSEKEKLNKELFELEKDDPFNGYLLFLESSKKDIK